MSERNLYLAELHKLEQKIKLLQEDNQKLRNYIAEIMSGQHLPQAQPCPEQHA